MQPDPLSNLHHPFTMFHQVPGNYQQYQITGAFCQFYQADNCEIFFQEIYIEELQMQVWYNVIHVKEDNLTIRFEPLSKLERVLVHVIQNGNELYFLQREIGIDIPSSDYLYLHTDFGPKDLRVFLSTGCYQFIALGLTSKNHPIEREVMRCAATMELIGSCLSILGLPLPSASAKDAPYY